MDTTLIKAALAALTQNKTYQVDIDYAKKLLTAALNDKTAKYYATQYERAESFYTVTKRETGEVVFESASFNTAQEMKECADQHILNLIKSNK